MNDIPLERIFEKFPSINYCWTKIDNQRKNNSTFIVKTEKNLHFFRNK